jgi:hypothetical protein
MTPEQRESRRRLALAKSELVGETGFEPATRWDGGDPEASLNVRVLPGGAADLGPHTLRKRLEALPGG